MKTTSMMMMAALALSACDKASAERGQDKSDSKSQRESEDDAPVKKTAAPKSEAAATASAAAAPTASAEEDSPEIADASGAPPAPSADDDAFKDVQIPVGVTIPTEEDYEEKAEKEITAANFESELSKIEKDLSSAK